MIAIGWLLLPDAPLADRAHQPSAAETAQERMNVFVSLEAAPATDLPPTLPAVPEATLKPRAAPTVAASVPVVSAPRSTELAEPNRPPPRFLTITLESDTSVSVPAQPQPTASFAPVPAALPAAGTPADPSVRDAYVRALMAALLKHQSYPAAARKERARGVVKVRFSINRQGKVLSSSIASSPGFAILEQAALEVLRRADPLPHIPEGIANDQLTVTVPIKYALITR